MAAQPQAGAEGAQRLTQGRTGEAGTGPVIIQPGSGHGDAWPTLTAHVSEPSPEQEIRGAGRALSSGGRPRAPALGVSGEQERCDQAPTSLANLGAPEDQILWSFHVSHVEEFMHPCRVFLSFCFN